MQASSPRAPRAYVLSVALAFVAVTAAAAWWFVARQPAAGPAAPSPDISPGLQSPPAASGTAGASPQAGAVAAAGAPVVPEVGSPAPDFALRDLEGRMVRLSDLRGRPILVNFWATWCPPCRQEMPEIERFVQRHRGQIEVLGVDVGEPAEALKAFLAKNRYSWRFLVDPNGEVMERYRVFAIPTSYFIDREGVVRVIHTGSMSYAQLQSFSSRVGVPVD